MGKIKVIKDQNTFYICDNCDNQLEMDETVCAECGNSVKEISRSKRGKIKSESSGRNPKNSTHNNKRRRQYKVLSFFSALNKFLAILLVLLGAIFLLKTNFELTYYQYGLVLTGMGFVVLNLLFYGQLIDIVMDIKSDTQAIIDHLMDSDKLE